MSMFLSTGLRENFLSKKKFFQRSAQPPYVGDDVSGNSAPPASQEMRSGTPALCSAVLCEKTALRLSQPPQPCKGGSRQKGFGGGG